MQTDPLDGLEVGASASIAKTITDADIVLFAGVSLDTNPAHLDEVHAAASRFGGRIAHGMLSAGLISAVLGTRLPGPGTVYLGQQLRFLAPVRPGDTVRATATVKSLDRERRRVTLTTTCHVGDTAVIDGEALVWVPAPN